MGSPRFHKFAPFAPFRRVTRGSRGFTLIEMMVSLAIIAVISTIVLTNQNSFNRTIQISNVAADIALAVRNAQIFGIGSRAPNIALLVPDAGYGLEFDSSTPTQFILFADTYPSASSNATSRGQTLSPLVKPGDNRYENTQGNSDTLIQTYTINNTVNISRICTYASQGNNVGCTKGGGIWQSNDGVIDVVFTRPNTDTSIIGLTTGRVVLDTTPGVQAANQACIELKDTRSTTYRSVMVSSVGSVWVVNTQCP